MDSANRIRLGVLCALLAAFFNSTSGIFSKLLIGSFRPEDIAFSKCLVAFLMLGVWVVSSGCWRRISWRLKSLLAIAISALFGIFGLFTFETIAYQEVAAPLVVVCLIGSSTMTTLVAGHYFFGERITANTLLCLVMILAGLLLMLPQGVKADPTYILLAMCSGACYGAFLLLTKYLHLAEGIEGTWLLIGMGMLYLLPLTSTPGTLLFDLEAWRYLLPLAIFPTIFGYFFTIKALRHAPATTVQLFEVSEPVFSALLAFLVLRELVTLREGMGALLVVAALLIYHFKFLDYLKQKSMMLIK